MKFTLEIDCNNAAFEDGVCDEIGRILAKLAERMDYGAQPEMLLWDVNGNLCGVARFIDDAQALEG